MCKQVELLGSIIILALLSAVLLPFIARGLRQARIDTCAQNLRILHRTGLAYATANGGWPDRTGEDLWKSFARTNPPLLKDEALEVLVCPVLESGCAAGETDYRGPTVPWKELASAAPVAADKPDNHGDDEGGCVLYKDGRVVELERQEWKDIASRLSP
jgi:type II secretory pathway pseudopilin PulG